MSRAAQVAAYGRRWPRSSRWALPAGGVGPVTFPTTLLRIRVELYLGALGWVDISTRVQYEEGITIERGLRPEQHRASPAQCSMK